MKPLLAMPLVGVCWAGRAGGVLFTGLIADMLVDLIPRLAHQYAVDILLCIPTQDDCKLVQERRRFVGEASQIPTRCLPVCTSASQSEVPE